MKLEALEIVLMKDAKGELDRKKDEINKLNIFRQIKK